MSNKLQHWSHRMAGIYNMKKQNNEVREKIMLVGRAKLARNPDDMLLPITLHPNSRCILS